MSNPLALSSAQEAVARRVELKLRYLAELRSWAEIATDKDGNAGRAKKVSDSIEQDLGIADKS